MHLAFNVCLFVCNSVCGHMGSYGLNNVFKQPRSMSLCLYLNMFVIISVICVHIYVLLFIVHHQQQLRICHLLSVFSMASIDELQN